MIRIRQPPGLWALVSCVVLIALTLALTPDVPAMHLTHQPAPAAVGIYQRPKLEGGEADAALRGPGAENLDQRPKREGVRLTPQSV